MMQLTQKETSLLKDMKDQESLCIEKYQKHAGTAHDPQLKALFDEIVATEKRHLEVLTQIGNGQTPAGGNGAAGQAKAKTFQAFYPAGGMTEKQEDSYLCSDLLATEKHVSSLYNTCVFEFGQPELRQALNKIQSDEQFHGEQLWQYMKTNGMYS